MERAYLHSSILDGWPDDVTAPLRPAHWGSGHPYAGLEVSGVGSNGHDSATDPGPPPSRNRAHYLLVLTDTCKLN